MQWPVRTDKASRISNHTFIAVSCLLQLNNSTGEQSIDLCELGTQVPGACGPLKSNLTNSGCSCEDVSSISARSLGFVTSIVGQNSGECFAEGSVCCIPANRDVPIGAENDNPASSCSRGDGSQIFGPFFSKAGSCWSIRSIKSAKANSPCTSAQRLPGGALQLV